VSREDYVEAIFQLLRERLAVRGKDIAERLRVRRPSVTSALQILARDGLVNHSPYDVVTLTETGRKVAGEIVRRHEVIKAFLVDVLGVPEHEAEVTACGLEHAVSSEAVTRLAALTAGLKERPELLVSLRGQSGRVCA